LLNGPPSSMRQHVCRLHLLVVLASEVSIGFESRRTHHILLSLPQPACQTPVFISLRNRVAQHTPPAVTCHTDVNTDLPLSQTGCPRKKSPLRDYGLTLLWGGGVVSAWRLCGTVHDLQLQCQKEPTDVSFPRLYRHVTRKQTTSVCRNSAPQARYVVTSGLRAGAVSSPRLELPV
jgi:hypothetical protein